MKIITDVYNVIKNANATSDSKKIFKILEIDLTDYSMVIPAIEYSYLNGITLSTMRDSTIANYIINGSKKTISEVQGVTTIDEETLKLLATDTSNKSKIENLTHLLDFLRQCNAKLVTTNFERKKRAITIDGEYVETPGIYLAYFSNIRYSSKDLGISIPYVVNGVLTQAFSGDTEDVKRLVSANIVTNEGDAVKTMDVILSDESYDIFKDKVDINEIYHVENGIVGDNKDFVYVVSTLPNKTKLVTVQVDKLLHYSPIKKGNIDVLCHPAVIQDTLYSLNFIIRMIKSYRGGNALIKNALNITNDGASSIYDIPQLPGSAENSNNPTIEFYLKGKKAVPSYKKLLNTFIDFDEYEVNISNAIIQNNITEISNLIENAKSSLGVPKDFDILNEKQFMESPNKEAALPLVAYSSFLNSVNVISSLEDKYKENLKRIDELESIRETLKARLSHVRYCLNAKGKLPLKQRAGVVIAVDNAPHITF